MKLAYVLLHSKLLLLPSLWLVFFNFFFVFFLLFLSLPLFLFFFHINVDDDLRRA